LGKNTELTGKIPESWVWTTVGKIYDIVGGGTPSTRKPQYWGGKIPWITSADIHDIKGIRPRKYVTKLGINESATNLVPEGSIIVVTRVGLGKVALTKIPICFSQDSQALIGINTLINPEYALYYLSMAVQVFKYKHRGTTIAGVTKKQLRDLPFPLAPLLEQGRIVSKLEELFTKLDAGVKSLNKVVIIDEKLSKIGLNQSERLRRSILKQAFKGGLVPQEPSDEPADILLEQIIEEREKKKLNKTSKEKMKNRIKRS
jgi:type I restriction enzyme S subunit